MFSKLKTRNDQRSVFKDEILPSRYSKSAGATSSVTKANEGTRLVRCKHCGWICDRERDIRAEDQSFAGIGVSYSSQKIASSSIGDAPLSSTSSGSSNYFVLSGIDESNIALLVHADSNFNDFSNYNHIPTESGGISINTSNPMIGSGDGNFDGVDDYVSYPYHSIFDLGTSDFRFECRIIFNDLPITDGIQQVILERTKNLSITNGGYIFSITKEFTVAGYNISFYCYQSAFQQGEIAAAEVLLSNGVEYHFVVTRTSGVGKILINDVDETNLDSLGSLDIINTGADYSLYLGVNSTPATDNNFFNGRMDEILFINGGSSFSGSNNEELPYSIGNESDFLVRGDRYYNRDVRSGCPSCGSYLYDGDEPFQEVKFDV